MPALDYPLEVDQGADFKKTFPVMDRGTNQPIESLVNWTVSGQIRDSTSRTATLLHTLDVSFTGSNLVLQISKEASSDWDWRVGWYDVEITDPDDKTVRFLEGWVLVKPEMTRAVV